MSQWVCLRSEVNSGAYATFNSVLTSNLISQPLNSCIFIVTCECYTCSGIDLWPHTHLLWPLRVVSHPKSISKLLIFVDLAQLHFCLTYKNSHRFIIDCHTPVTFQLGEDKILIYLIRRNNWQNTSYVLILSLFSSCVLLFDSVPCITLVAKRVINKLY